MSKYIIDIPKTVGVLEAVGSVHYTYFDGIQVQTIVLKGDEIEELNSDYIKEHYGDLQDDAYERGYGIGYQKGIEDGKAQSELGCEGCKYEGISRALEPCHRCARNSTDHWQAKQTDNEIKVGDEVYAYTPSGKTRPFVIIKIYDEDGVKYYSGINADGNHVQGGLNYIKTGRHFPHVAELLKEMQS